MKKFSILLLVCMLVCPSLFAAAETAEVLMETTSVTLLERAQHIAEDIDELIVMTEDDLYDLIGIAPEDYVDFVYLAHVDSLTGRELIAVQAFDEEAALRIIELLQGYLELRLHETRNYLPETYQVLCEAKVTQKDLLVVLTIAAPNPAEEELLLTEE